MIKIVKKIKFEIIILLFFIILFTYKLSSVPTNITGDETIYLNSAYQTLFSSNLINPFLLMEDHTKIALNFYWMGLWIKFFGLNNAVFAMRLSVALAGIGTLLIFFELLKKNTSKLISFVTTLLLGTSIWFLNFARSGWLNLVAVFFGLLMIYFLEKAMGKKKLKNFFIAGVVGAFCCYSYLSGYIFPISTFILFAIKIVFSKKKLRTLKEVCLYALGFGLFILPVAIMAVLMWQNYSLRPSVVFIFQKGTDWLPLLIKQSSNVLSGLFLLSGDSIGKGVENLRYYPEKKPVVDIFIKLLFFSGVISFGYKFLKKPTLNIWPIIYIVTIFTVGVLTIDSPNLARTVPILICIYFLSGLMLYRIIMFAKKRLTKQVFLIMIIVVSISVSYNNIVNYFNWAESFKTSQFRQPAISYEDFPFWQNYQIDLIKNGKYPIVNQVWYVIRENVINDKKINNAN